MLTSLTVALSFETFFARLANLRVFEVSSKCVDATYVEVSRMIWMRGLLESYRE